MCGSRVEFATVATWALVPLNACNRCSQGLGTHAILRSPSWGLRRSFGNSKAASLCGRAGPLPKGVWRARVEVELNADPTNQYSLGFVVALAAIAMIGVSTPVPMEAQILYGSIVGNVTDSTGAVIPGSQVTITHEETGATRSGESNEAGAYSFSTVATGTYRVEVRSDGFSSNTTIGVAVTVNTLPVWTWVSKLARSPRSSK